MGSLTVERDGHAIAVTDHGGPGPAVVMLHGFGTDGELFAPQVARFGAEWRCVTVDLRGHGGTRATGPFTMWDSARDVLAVLDHLGLDRPVVLGVSQGGFVALRMALLAPDRLAGLALVGTSAVEEDEGQKQAYLALGVALSDGEDGTREALAPVWAAVVLGDADPGPWVRKIVGWDTQQVLWSLDALVQREEVASRLGEVTMPVLVMHGTGDRSYPAMHADLLAGALPNVAAAIQVERGAHFLSWTDPEPVNAALADFVATFR